MTARNPSHPDHHESQMEVEVYLKVRETTGFAESATWASVRHEIRTMMSPHNALQHLRELVADSLREADAQFQGVAHVAAINRADQVKQLTNSEDS